MSRRDMRLAITMASGLALLGIPGCYLSHERGEPTVLPDGAVVWTVPDASVDSSRPPPPPPPPLPPTGQVDLLFVVDNSNSMSEEQRGLKDTLAPLVDRLATGDANLDGVPEWPAVVSLHAAVATVDMGTGGFTVPTCARSDFGDDGVFWTQGTPEFAGCMPTYPSFLDFRVGGGVSSADLAHDVACLTTVGTGGCGFEQQLEAMLKALSPSAPTPWTAAGYTAPTFFRNTFGHGDRENDGFLRDDSTLVIVMLTDEEDCSARDPEIFNPSSPTYGATDLNLRCFAHADAALHPIRRYVDGLVQLRRNPGRVVFAPIVGIPQDLVPSPGARADWGRLVSPDPSVRDDRLEERVDPATPTRLLTSCSSDRGAAYPPIRILQTAQGVEERGGRVVLGSICDESYDGVMEEIVNAIWR